MLRRVSRRLAPYFRVFSLRILSVWRLLLFAFVAWTLFDTVLVHHRLDAAGQAYMKPQSPVRVYIASLHWNNERILRDSWNQGLLDLVSVLGPSNVFVSLYESGSRDGSKDAIGELDKALEVMGVPRNITLDKTTHAVAMASPPLEPGNGWVKTPRGRIELRRISYLAQLRNRSLQPLKDMARNGIEFDYVLFLGDVVPDVLVLLNTNNREYAAACSLDFSKPPQYYDTFALRDANGHEHATQTWPYFRSSKSRAAMKRSEPVPVSSCWNGVVFMPAASFVGEQGLTFRAIDDSLAANHLEGSECCLIHADNPESETRGVYLNPNVRVGYDRRAYELVRSGGSWLTHTQILYGLWNNRLTRWFTTPWFKEMWVWSLERAWQRQHPGRSENGMMCVINEMQVLIHNGWAHV
ncbi:hypothetical protein BHE90_015682 [Fusarium euwallaceae]|uniref:Glycosyltransferase family 69 protein n=1 Tax=Fusarium euwallaceae TaxID=1147111 RepID=A0A430L2G1_9HYPO|nr:hypothetical protein BHE90_015682 [Fusarium euwallaceae]